MKKILIVEDEKDLVEVVSARLKKAGYEVAAAYDGKDGLKKAESEKPDLIILDLMLPELDGYEVCRILKTVKKVRTPIIVLTARFQPDDVRFGKAMGADAYITKPYESKVLLSKIRELTRE